MAVQELNKGFSFTARNPITGERQEYVVMSVTIQRSAVSADVLDRTTATRILTNTLPQ